MQNTTNTIEDKAGIITDTDERGLNKVKLTIPCCGGIEKLEIKYSTFDDRLMLDVFNLITSKLGVGMAIATTKKGGGGT